MFSLELPQTLLVLRVDSVGWGEVDLLVYKPH